MDNKSYDIKENLYATKYTSQIKVVYYQIPW